MVAARQEADLRPQLERLDRLVLRSEGIEPSALTFAFRPLWQMDAATAANVALSKTQATAVYAGLKLWPEAVMARLVEAQLAEDGTYPGAEAVFAEMGGASAVADFDPNQPRDPQGRWTAGGAGSVAAPQPLPKQPPAAATTASSSATESILGWLGNLNPIGTASAQEIDPEEEGRGLAEESLDPTAELRAERYANARTALRAIDPTSKELETLQTPGSIPPEAEVQRIEAASEAAAIRRVRDYLLPDGKPIGQPGRGYDVREMTGGLPAAQRDYNYLSVGGIPVPFDKGLMVRLPGRAGFITFRPITSSPGSPAIDINVPDMTFTKMQY